MTSRVAGAGLASVVALGLLAGCGGDGGGGEGLPTRSPAVSPTRTLPAPTRTAEPTDQPTDEQTAAPTRGPIDTEAPDNQASEPTEEAAPPAEDASAEQGDSNADSVPAGVWVLLVLVLLGGAVLAWVLVARSRRRQAWQDRLRSAEAEVAWLARELLPQLRRAGSLDRADGGWQVAVPRVAAAEDQLTVLESSAPGEMEGARARALRDAVRRARARMERLAHEGPDAVWALDVDEAVEELERALAAQEVVAR